jgi:hypothetical protein
MRNGGSPPAHLTLFSLFDTSGWLQYKWSQPKALADKATEQRRHEAAAWEKALADKANKQPHHKTAAQEKVLPDDAKAQAAELVLATTQAGVRRIRNCPSRRWPRSKLAMQQWNALQQQRQLR